MNYSNTLITIRKNHPDPHTRNWAKLMVEQITTAGGKHILKRTGELDDDTLTRYLKDCEKIK